MIARVKALGASAELITNGTLLGREMSRRLVEAGLDRLWVSLDGATPESYRDVRLGALLPEVLANLDGFKPGSAGSLFAYPPAGDRVRGHAAQCRGPARRAPARPCLGVSRVIVSNVLPYTPELWDEMLYPRAMAAMSHAPSPGGPPRRPSQDRLPTPEPGIPSSGSSGARGAGGSTAPPWGRRAISPFRRGRRHGRGLAGNVSPCLALLHDHTSYLHEKERRSRRYTVGHLGERRLIDLWEDPGYTAFRTASRRSGSRTARSCAGCELSVSNEEDCFGNTHPNLRRVPMGQGLIRCRNPPLLQVKTSGKKCLFRWGI